MSSEQDTLGSLTLHSTVEDPKLKIPYMKKFVAASKMISMWPNTDKKNVFLYHLLVWSFTVHNVLFIATFCVQIINEFKNMDSITALIDLVTVFISGAFRYVYVYVRGGKYTCIVSMIHDNFIHFPFYPGKNKTSLDKYYKIANRMILAYATFTFFWILQICLTPLFIYIWESSQLPVSFNQTEPEHIPYPVAIKVYAPFDLNKQPGNALFYIYQCTGFLLFGVIYIVVDSFWYMSIFLTIGQFTLLDESLNTIAEYLKKSEAGQEVQLWNEHRVKEAEVALNKCIKHHQFVRQFLIAVDELNNPNVLVDSLHAAISIGFILLDVTIALKIPDLNKVMYAVEYLATSVIHMFFFDWLASKLIEKEEKLAETAYDIQWYKCPSIKLQLMLLMTQARRPCRLTGGKMYQLSLSFFTTMLKAIFSYFTFLFQLINEKPKSM